MSRLNAPIPAELDEYDEDNAADLPSNEAALFRL